jgi:hypothetical protein
MKTRVYNLVILDESGSMKAIRQDAITCFNNLITAIGEEAAGNPLLEQYILFYTFNSEGIREQIPLVRVGADTPRLEPGNYRPQALTPLYDAIGKATGRLRVLLDENDDYAVLVTILTDGAENSSTIYNGETVSSIVRQLNRQNWVFTYIGTNHDVNAQASRIGITNARTFQYRDSGLVDFMNGELENRRTFYRNLAGESLWEIRNSYFKGAEKGLAGSPDGEEMNTSP